MPKSTFRILRPPARDSSEFAVQEWLASTLAPPNRLSHQTLRVFLAPSTFNRFAGEDFFPLGVVWLPEIAEVAFLGGAIREFQRDLRRPAGLALNYIFHDAHGAGNSVNHGFPEITFPGFRYFCFAHGTESMPNRNKVTSGEWRVTRGRHSGAQHSTFNSQPFYAPAGTVSAIGLASATPLPRP